MTPSSKFFVVAVLPSLLLLLHEALAQHSFAFYVVAVAVAGAALAPYALRLLRGHRHRRRDAADRRRGVVLLRPFSSDKRVELPDDVPFHASALRIDFLIAGLLVLATQQQLSEARDEIAGDLALQSSLVLIGAADFDRMHDQRNALAYLDQSITPTWPLLAILYGYTAFFVLSMSWWFGRRWSVGEKLSVSLHGALGPVRALASENSRDVEGGPNLVRVRDEVWQAALIRLLAASQCSVMQIGESEALDWELSLLASFGDPRRVVFFYDERDAYDASRWAALLARMDALGWTLPTQAPGTSALIFFDAGGRSVQVEAALRDGEYGAALVRWFGPLGERPLLREGVRPDALSALIAAPNRNDDDDAPVRVALRARVLHHAYEDYAGIISIFCGSTLLALTLSQAGYPLGPLIRDEGVLRVITFLAAPALFYAGFLVLRELVDPGAADEREKDVDMFSLIGVCAVMLALAEIFASPLGFLLDLWFGVCALRHSVWALRIAWSMTVLSVFVVALGSTNNALWPVWPMIACLLTAGRSEIRRDPSKSPT